jgi:hypothetical protein
MQLVVTTSAFATTYYVATNGSDSNPGTLAQPFLTIQHAADNVNAGDTVIVETGVYSDSTQHGALVSITRSGTAGNYITFQSQNKWGAILDGVNNTALTGVDFAGSYIRFQDFELRGFSEEALSTYEGGKFINIVGNNIHDIGRFCTDTTKGLDGIFIATSNNVVEQNLVHDIGRYAPGENGCSPKTRYYKNHDHAIYVDASFGGADKLMVRNNVFYRLKRGWGIHVYPSPVDGLSVLNNTFIWGNTWQPGFIIFAGGGATHFRVENNIAYSPTQSFVHFLDTSGYTGIIANNLTYNGTISDATPSGVTFSANMDNVDPKLINAGDSTEDDASLPDARLTSGSPAIGAGAELSDVTIDYTGAPRSNPPSIGAYEFVSVSAPSPPTNLTTVVH